jgi:hypothetical protein
MKLSERLGIFLYKLAIGMDKYSNSPEMYPFIMSVAEKELLLKLLKDSKHYLEFGSGGSTIFALCHSSAHVISVESSPQWIKKMKEYRIIRKNENERLQWYFANIGETTDMGYPKDELRYDLFPTYSKGVFTKFQGLQFDLILVDGRFRVACIYACLLNQKDNIELKILVHDFWEREPYHEVLKYLDPVTSTDSMVLLMPKRNIHYDEVLKDYERTTLIAY